jgi:hypothetical protein
MKRTLLVLLVAAFVVAGVTVPTFAGNASGDYFGRSMFRTGQAKPGCPPTPELAVFEDDPIEDPSGEAIIFDAVILRPLGLASMVVGAAGALVSTPWAESSCTWGPVERQLIRKPFDYTFCRPLGNIFDK